MAATLTADNELTWTSFPIEKIETTPDGNVMVWGKATDGSVDSDEQIVDPGFAAKALSDWMESGPNVRVQHQAQRDPAGIGLTVEKDGDAHWVKSKIVEPVAKDLVKAGVLRAYSVGIARPTIVRDSVARGGRITDGMIVEISLVDRPANKNCGIQLVKMASSGSMEWVGKVFGSGDFISKATGGDVQLTLPGDVQVSFSPADLARIVSRKSGTVNKEVPYVHGGTVPPESAPKAEDEEELEKDVNFVHGGTVPVGSMPKGEDGEDIGKAKLTTEARNALPSSAFVFPEQRAYPIHDKKHARNALARVQQHGTSDEKAKVRAAVARRYPGIMQSKAATKAMDKKAVRKRVAQLAEEMVPDVTKKKKVLCPSCGARQSMKHMNCTECGKGMSGAMPLEKNHDFTCLKCGKTLDKGERFCPQCGKENPGYLPEADQKIPANTKVGEPVLTKSGFGNTPTPGDGVVGAHMQSVPAHMEPDGPAVEELETDMGLPHNGASKADSNAYRLAKVGATREMAAAHDFTCPAFAWDDALKCYPEGLSILDLPAWQAKALDFAATASYEEIGNSMKLAQHATTLKGAALEDVLEIKKDLFKAFSDANPGPGTFPTPGEMNPHSFRRPYLAAGHSAPSQQQGAPNTSPMEFGHVAAGNFTREYLDAGHAAESPNNTGASRPTTPKQPGVPVRLEYSNVQRENTAQAMMSMHDHVAQTFPDLCPMTGSVRAPGDTGNMAVHPQGIPEAQKSVVSPTMGKKSRKKLAKKIRSQMMAENQAPPFGGGKKDKTVSAGQLQKMIAATLKDRDKKLTRQLTVKGQAKKEREELARMLSDQLGSQIAAITPPQREELTQMAEKSAPSLTKAQISKMITKAIAAQQQPPAEPAPVSFSKAMPTRRQISRTIEKTLARQQQAQWGPHPAPVTPPVQPPAPATLTRSEIQKAIKNELRRRDEKFSDQRLIEQLTKSAPAEPAATAAPGQKTVTRAQLRKDRKKLAKKLRKRMLATVPEPPKNTAPPSVPAQKGLTAARVQKTIEQALAKRDLQLASQRQEELSERQRAQLARQLSTEISREVRSLAPLQAPVYAPAAPVAAPVTSDDITKAIAAALRSQNKELAKQLDRQIRRQMKPVAKKASDAERAANALADQPDPGTQPFKGMAMNALKMNGGVRSPAGAQAVAEVAGRTQAMMLRELEEQFRTTPDPAQREAAWRAITKMRGLTE